VAHRNARLTVHGRRLLIERVVTGGRPVAHVVKELGCSRATGYKWLARWRAEGDAGLHDRPCVARRLPGKTTPEAEARICRLRTTLKRGPLRLAPLLGIPASTVHAVLTRHGLNRLAWLDRPTGELVRRYERDRPGELLHVDVKKIGRLRDGGGWRVHGRDSAQHRRVHLDRNAGRRVGYEYVHAAIDDHTRLAYAEIHPDEKSATCAAFLRRAADHFAALGITRIERVMTDNAPVYRKDTPGATSWPSSAPKPGSPASTGPRPTARPNASTAPCATNGSTRDPSPAARTALTPYPLGYTPTTTTAPTPHSEASHPSAASTTVLANTVAPARPH
jgi:transposase